MRPVKGGAKKAAAGFGLDAIARAISRRTSRRQPITDRARKSGSGPLPRKALRSERARLADPWTSGRGLRGWGYAATALFFLATGVTGTVAGGHVATIRDRGLAGATALTRIAGFGLAEVRVTGNSKLTAAEVIEQMGLTGATSLVAFDPAAARRRLLQIPMVRSASVRVFLPGTVTVTVAEREPFAIWQHDGQVALIDREGSNLGPYDDIRYSHLPLVVGDGAQRRVGEVGDLIDPHPAVRSRVRAAVLVAERRWTLKLADGVDVMLPEQDPASAVALLARLDRETGLLNRDIVAVDLRLPDRVVVRLTDRAAAIRAEALRQRTRMPQRAGQATAAGEPRRPT